MSDEVLRIRALALVPGRDPTPVYMTTDHAASSHGLPCLVEPEEWDAYGPADLLPGTVVLVEQSTPLDVVERILAAGYAVQRQTYQNIEMVCVGRGPGAGPGGAAMTSIPQEPDPDSGQPNPYPTSEPEQGAADQEEDQDEDEEKDDDPERTAGARSRWGPPASQQAPARARRGLLSLVPPMQGAAIPQAVHQGRHRMPRAQAGDQAHRLIGQEPGAAGGQAGPTEGEPVVAPPQVPRARADKQPRKVLVVRFGHDSFMLPALAALRLVRRHHLPT